MPTKTFSVPNISCNHCIMTIKREIGRLPGVQSVDANLPRKEVIISYRTEGDLPRIKETLAEIGYPVAAEAK